MGDLGGVAALGVDRGVHLQALLAGDEVVLGAVAGGGVHQAGARLQRGVAGEEQAEVALAAGLRDEGVLVAGAAQAGQPLAADLDPVAGGGGRQAAGGQEGFGPAPGDQEVFGLAAGGRQRDADVVELRVGHHRQVGGEGPGGGGPDGEGDPGLAEDLLDGGLPGQQRKAHVDRGRGVLGVDDLGLGQGGLVGDAPVDRPLGPVEHPGAGEHRQLPDDGRLVRLRQREVGRLPQPHTAEPLELAAHDVDELQGVGLAQLAKLLDPELVLGAGLLLDLLLDRQAVAVPARDEARRAPHQQLGADHDVLEDLVQQGAVVDAASGIRRPVVQDEAGGVRRLTGGQRLLVGALLLPAGQPERLAAREVGPHRELGFWQAERRFPVQEARILAEEPLAQAGGRGCPAWGQFW